MLPLDPRLSDRARRPHRRGDAARSSSSTHRARRPPSPVAAPVEDGDALVVATAARPGSRRASCSPTPPWRPRRGRRATDSGSTRARPLAGLPAPRPRRRPVGGDEGARDRDAGRDAAPFRRRGVRRGRRGNAARRSSASCPPPSPGSARGSGALPPSSSAASGRPPAARPTGRHLRHDRDRLAGSSTTGSRLEGVELRMPSTARSGSAARCCCAATGTGRTRRPPPAGSATGDAGSLDEGGRLAVHGRLDDVVISGGENIWPAAGRGRAPLHTPP